MALTVRTITDEQIEMAKQMTGKGAASSALVACVELLADRTARVASLEKRVYELSEQLRVKDQTLHRAAHSASELLTVVQQGDWIHD